MIWLVLYGASIVAANAMIQVFGFWPVGFGLMAPAGVYAAGLSFTLRDKVQDRYGKVWTVGAVVIGAALSWLISPAFALASGAAFLVSELCDLVVYTPIRKRHRLLAIGLSNTVGLVIDSVLFLSLAFGSLDFLAGQVLAKMYMTILSLAIVRCIQIKHANDAQIQTSFATS